MDETSNNDALKIGEIRFVDNYIPLLEAGDYTIEVEQKLTGHGAYHVPDNTSFKETQEFKIAGPRFRLDPAHIQQRYPPPSSQGTFQNDLPHIVLTKRTLPWERRVFKKLNDPADRAIPWMALLLFDADELLEPVVGTNAGSPSPTGVTSIKVKDLQAGENRVLMGLDLLDPLDDLDEDCQVIDIDWDTFKEVMPNREELKYLVHCREINLADKAVAGPDRPGVSQTPGNGTAWYSIVVGGCFPSSPGPGEAGKLNVAHLVSLEGLESYFDDSDNTNLDSAFDRVRLVSLASWTFTCLPQGGESFSELMSALVAGDGQEALEFRLPVKQLDPGNTAEKDFAFSVLKAGYIPCSYQTRQGEQTFAWYRGPFTAQLAPRLLLDRQPFSSAAQAMVYDQDRGLFDLSYAVAWEIGRLVALSDQSFGRLLLNWRRKAHRLIDLLQERKGHSSLQVPTVTESELQGFQEMLKDNWVSDSWMSRFENYISKAIENVNLKPDDRQPFDASPERSVSVNTYSSLAGYLEESDVQQFLKAGDSQELQSICEWLAQLYLLYGVPFNNLVPDERLLPPASIRFFYLDQNWLEIMLDGSLSLCMHSSRDIFYQNLMHDVIINKVFEQVHTMRDILLGDNKEAAGNGSDGPMAGLLLRSNVVSGWPGMEVRAFRHTDGNQGSGPIGLLRMDHLSADVLLCLFPAIPARIEFNEPKEGLHFGWENLDADCVVYRRLNLMKLRDSMKVKLGLDEVDEFGPAAFAKEVVRDPRQMVFKKTKELENDSDAAKQ